MFAQLADQQQLRELTQRALEDLTRQIWQQYDQAENEEALTRLRLVILARRAAVGRTPVR